jgi:diguanylate cyclase (GGDEF)-like protein
MAAVIDRKWQWFPIVTLIVSMVVGVYFFKGTLDSWANSTLTGYAKGLLSDINYELGKDEPDFQIINIDQYIGNLTQATEEQRITIINMQGTVVGDTALSGRAIKTLQNHANRPEFIQALESGSGSHIRFSQTLNIDLLYVASKINVSGEDYVLRLSIPTHLLNTMSQKLLLILIVMIAISAALLVASSIISNKQISARVSSEQALQEERIQQRTFEIELLHRLANMLAACKSVDEAQHVVEDIVPRILGEVNGSVAMMRASRNQLQVKLDWGGKWPAACDYAPEECWALRKGKYHLSNDEYSCLPCVHMSDVGEDQAMCIPLTAHGNTIGMLHLYFGDKSIVVSEHRRQLAFTVAEHLGLALANLSMQEKLRAQAISDPLTGLYNRRFFEEQLAEELVKSKREQTDLSLLMLDLDHFKRFNDNFGHDAGDFVLKSISTLLVDIVSDENVVCRLGGEEFAIIAPNMSVDAAQNLAQQICDAIRQLHLKMKDLTLGQLSISIGIATAPTNSIEIDELIKFSDVALYESKERGRDQVLHYLMLNKHDKTSAHDS